MRRRTGGGKGLTGNWMPTMEGMKPRPAGEDAVSVFTALQDDMGLKLMPSTGVEETLTVDAVERPSAD